MPTLEEFLSQGQAPGSLEEFLEATRPSLFNRASTHAAARTADISDFLTSGPAAVALPGLYLGKKIQEAFQPGAAQELGQHESDFRRAVGALPQAQGFGEKAADFAGNVAPDVALGIATAGVSTAGSAAAAARGVTSPFMRLLLGEAAQSAALAPIEFGTRDPASAAISTIAGPVLGSVVARGVGKLLGRGAAPAVEEIGPPRLDEHGFAVDAPLAQAPTPPPITFDPLPIRKAVAPQFGDQPIYRSADEVVQARAPQAIPPPAPVPEKIPTEISEFAQAARMRAQERIIQATMEGRPIRTGDLMELGDEEISAAAHEAHSLMQRQSLAALTKAGASDEQLKEAAVDLAETGLRLPPKINQEIADAADTLPPGASARFVSSLKAKGVCPI